MDINAMMGKVREVQEKMKASQENLKNIHASGESGGEMVKVTVNGERRVTEMQIDDSLINGDDKEMLRDLIIAATNKALENVEVSAKEEMKKATEGMIPNIPGMDLGNFF